MRHSAGKSLATNSKKDFSLSYTSSDAAVCDVELSCVHRTDPTSGIQTYLEKHLTSISAEFRVGQLMSSCSFTAEFSLAQFLSCHLGSGDSSSCALPCPRIKIGPLLATAKQTSAVA